jgi:hypothetical protein
MNTKILIGSIGAVAILILVSFTNVVGVQSTKSGSIYQSPLFSIRTQKAISENTQNKLTTDYLNKGENTLAIPPCNRVNALLQKLIYKIRIMDDETFNRFKSSIISHLEEDKSTENIDSTNYLSMLKPTWGGCMPTIGYDPLLYCFLFFIYWLVVGTIENLIYLFIILSTIHPDCQYR